MSEQRSDLGSTGSNVVIYSLFFLSGISGLMYQVVWVRMLGRVLGNTVYATATILAAFMAGLAVGSFVAGRLVDRARRPLRWYALLEIGIAAMAVLSIGMATWPTPLYRALYDMADQSRAALLLGQVGVSAMALLIPTALMGATLPVLTTFCVRRSRSFSKGVGFLYAVNTLGAMVGTLIAGFVLIGTIGESNTILLGAALNVMVAAAVLVISRTSPTADVPHVSDMPSAPAHYGAAVRRTILACCAATGLVMVALEVAWGRMLILYQDTSIYAFSAMLATVLGGIGVGSLIGGALADRARDPLRLLARLVLGMGAMILCGMVVYMHVNPGLFIPPLAVVGPVALLSGIAFPVYAQCYRCGGGAGRSIGMLYGWNTIGSIAGALLGGFVLVPWLGSSRAGVVLGACAVAIGLVLLAMARPRIWQRSCVIEAVLIVASVLFFDHIDDPYRKIMSARIWNFFPNGSLIYKYTEDATASVVSFTADRVNVEAKRLWVNGYGMTQLVTPTKMMAHLPIWLADEPRDMAVICFGMGTTFRSATRHADIDVTAVEIVPTVVDCFKFYHADASAVMAQPNAHVAVDDGRSYLTMRADQYDVITIDPAPPLHAAGTVNLYTREFFELCQARTRAGGVVCLWVPRSEQSEVAMICRTFGDVFKHITVWSPTHSIPGLFLIGSDHQVTDVAGRVRRGYENKQIVADMLEWGDEVAGPEAVLGWYICDGDELRALFSDAAIITDDRPWTEFPLWRNRKLAGQPRLDGNRLREMIDKDRAK